MRFCGILAVVFGMVTSVVVLAGPIKSDFKIIDGKECINVISPADAQKAIDKTLSGKLTKCDPKIETCLCFDGIVWEAAEIKAGKLENNAQKLKDHQDAQKAKEDTEKSEIDAFKALRTKLDAGTITDAEIKEMLKFMAKRTH